MAIRDSLRTAYENLLRVIPRPLTAEEEAERVRTGKGNLDVDPAALHDGARRFVDALSADPTAAAELERRGTLCVALTADGSEYSVAARKAQKTLANWNLASQFAEHPVYLDFVQKTVQNILCAAGEELVAEVRGKYEKIKWLLAEDGVPQTIQPLLEAWRDAAWSIVARGENYSLDGCYWLLHADRLQYGIFVPAAAPEVRQAAEGLVAWLDGTHGNDSESFIERLLAEPDDVDLTARELAMVEAYLKQPVSLSAIQQEKRALNQSEILAKRNKLRLIRDFNRNLQAARAPSPDAGLSGGGPEADAIKTWAPKRRGRKKADYATVEREAQLAADWEQARESGVYKPDFAKERGMRVRELDTLLNRVAKRKSRSDK